MEILGRVVGLCIAGSLGAGAMGQSALPREVSVFATVEDLDRIAPALDYLGVRVRRHAVDGAPRAAVADAHGRFRFARERPGVMELLLRVL